MQVKSALCLIFEFEVEFKFLGWRSWNSKLNWVVAISCLKWMDSLKFKWLFHVLMLIIVNYWPEIGYTKPCNLCHSNRCQNLAIMEWITCSPSPLSSSFVYVKLDPFIIIITNLQEFNLKLKFRWQFYEEKFQLINSIYGSVRNLFLEILRRKSKYSKLLLAKENQQKLHPWSNNQASDFHKYGTEQKKSDSLFSHNHSQSLIPDNLKRIIQFMVVWILIISHQYFFSLSIFFLSLSPLLLLRVVFIQFPVSIEARKTRFTKVFFVAFLFCIFFFIHMSISISINTVTHSHLQFAFIL